LKALKVPHAKIVEEGQDYILKKWINGVRGDRWFKKWNEEGRNLSDTGFIKLMHIFDTMSLRGIYIQNLKDLNMIFDGKRWVVVDVGYFVYEMIPREAKGRYYDTFDRRWNKKKWKRFECPKLMELRGESVQEVSFDAADEVDRRRIVREQKEKQEAKDRYWKLHMAGKTDQAKADLARLAEIRKQREEALSKRKAEQDAKTAALEAKTKASAQKRG